MGSLSGQLRQDNQMKKMLCVTNVLACMAFVMLAYVQVPKKSSTLSPICAPNTASKNCGKAWSFSFVCRILLFWRSGRFLRLHNVVDAQRESCMQSLICHGAVLEQTLEHITLSQPRYGLHKSGPWFKFHNGPCQFRAALPCR